MAPTMNECDHAEWGKGLPNSYAVERCAHYGNRAVVIIKSPYTDNAFVDYVDYKPLAVQSEYVPTSEADETFERLNALMLAGVAPYVEV
jgi:hypothetical protein